ncbi:MAG TPA: adenylate/guanylate cyclase domain-containing protein, partial [Acidobacteriota bacterium]
YFDGPTRAVRFGQELAKLGCSIGIHTGECEVINDELFGNTVDLSVRLSELAKAGQIIVTRIVKDLVTDPAIEFIPFTNIDFEYSKHELSLCILKKLR